MGEERTKNKSLSMLLAMALLLCACAPAGSVEKTAAPAAVSPAPTEPARADIVVLYTNDVHCGVKNTMGYSSVAALKAALGRRGGRVALVDAGDAVQGETIGAVSKGGYPIEMMNRVGYDLAVPGNHEFDYGMDRFLELAGQAAFPYVCCNLTDLRTGKPVLDAYRILTLGEARVAFVGVTTPKTVTSSTPAYFQDETGAFIYGFQQDESGEKLYACVQGAVDAARADGADYVIVVGHCGIGADVSPWTSSEIIGHTSGFDAWIDGHSHSTVECERVKNADGKPVVLTQTGTKLAAVGMLTIDAAGVVRARLITDGGASETMARVESEYAEQMKAVVAHSTVDLTVTMPDDPDTRIIRNAETNLGDLCADAYRVVGGADVGIVNGGGVRVSIPAGDITYEAIINVHPFGNDLCVAEVTGAQILDALEFGARDVPGENGGFLQVSGLTYEIHTYVPSSVSMDENRLFVAVEGEYRVKNVLVGGEPLDPARIYTLASHNYLLKKLGDGYTMFQNSVLIKDRVMTDNQMLITFMTENLGGEIGAEYADPFGQGRIVIVDETPVSAGDAS